jgi:hypothetical protein
MATTRAALVRLAILWALLLITAAGIEQNTWILLAVGSIVILQNIFIAGKMRRPDDYGLNLEYVEVFGEPKALYAVEQKYPGVGRSLVKPCFPGQLRADEIAKWAELGADID